MNLKTPAGILTAGIGVSVVVYLGIVLVAQPALALAAMIAIIIVAFWVVVGVMIYGAQENVSGHGLTASDAPSVQAWNDRANRLDELKDKQAQAAPEVKQER